jgi:molybdopterin synthase catalytic subunit
MQLVLTDRQINPEAEMQAFRIAHPQVGAIASFVGLCRGSSSTGAVLALELETYPGFTERVITDRLRALADRPGICGLLVVHRFGRCEPGDAIVVVAAASPHRRAALALVDETMDWLKVEAPFWKREETMDGTRWIEPTAQDHADASRWCSTGVQGLANSQQQGDHNEQ